MSLTNTGNPCRVVVLISGSGSNLQAIIDGKNNGSLDIEIAAVVSNKANAYGVERAKNAQIATEILSHREFADRASYDQALIQVIDRYQPDLLVLAGFMRILTAEFTQHYLGRALNIHPSLLPKYTGLNTHQRALDTGDSEHGVSVHFVTEQLDGGAVIAQATVSIDDGDDAPSLAAKVLVQEHQLYPAVIQWFAQGRLKLVDQVAYFDEQALGLHGAAWPQ